MIRWECDLCARTDKDSRYKRPCVLVVDDTDNEPETCPWSWVGLDNEGRALQADWVRVRGGRDCK